MIKENYLIYSRVRKAFTFVAPGREMVSLEMVTSGIFILRGKKSKQILFGSIDLDQYVPCGPVRTSIH
jgi:hypothetical protein